MSEQQKVSPEKRCKRIAGKKRASEDSSTSLPSSPGISTPKLKMPTPKTPSRIATPYTIAKEKMEMLQDQRSQGQLNIQMIARGEGFDIAKVLKHPDDEENVKSLVEALSVMQNKNDRWTVLQATGWKAEKYMENGQQALAVIAEARRRMPDMKGLDTGVSKETWKKWDEISEKYWSVDARVKTAKGHVKRAWGEDVLKRLEELGMGSTFWQHCQQLAKKHAWEQAQLRVQRAMVERCGRKGAKMTRSFIPTDFYKALKIKTEKGLTKKEIEKLGCQIDDLGFIYPIDVSSDEPEEVIPKKKRQRRSKGNNQDDSEDDGTLAEPTKGLDLKMEKCKCRESISEDMADEFEKAYGNVDSLLGWTAEIESGQALCNKHIQLLVRKFGLRSTKDTAIDWERVCACAGFYLPLDKVKNMRGLAEWFGKSFEVFENSEDYSRVEEDTAFEGWECAKTPGRFNQLFSNLGDEKAIRDRLWEDGFVEFPHLLKNFLEAKPEGQLSIEELAAREAWVYSYHDIKIESEREGRRLNMMQHGMVQQGLRMCKVLVLLNYLLREGTEGGECPEMVAYPVPVEFGTRAQNESEFVFLNRPNQGDGDKSLYTEVIVAAPVLEAAPRMILGGIDDDNPLLGEYEQATNNGTELKLRFKGSEIAAGDELSSEPVGTTKGSVVFSSPKTARFVPGCPSVKTFFLRIPILYAAVPYKGKIGRQCERPQLGRVTDIMTSLQTLVPRNVLPTGEELPFTMCEPWTPVNKVLPWSSLGSAVIGSVLWEDSGVLYEVEQLLDGDPKEVIQVLEDDLEQCAQAIRRAWRVFERGERRVYGANSAFAALENMTGGAEYLEWVKDNEYGRDLPLLDANNEDTDNTTMSMAEPEVDAAESTAPAAEPVVEAAEATELFIPEPQMSVPIPVWKEPKGNVSYEEGEEDEEQIDGDTEMAG